MHTAEPPIEILKEWLEESPTVTGTYGHLLLEQKKSDGCEQLLVTLRPYFESAHLDARQHFHEVMRIDLHPDAQEEETCATYPNSLPSTAKRGLFGEALAGLITESYDFIGNHDWSIPVFLFRYHQDVEQYLFSLSRNPDKTRQVLGRLGSDFLALKLDANGAVIRFLSGEAKWRKSLTQSVTDSLLLGKKIDDPDGGKDKVHSGKGIWNEFNHDTPIPHGLSQLHRLLRELAPEEYAETIVSLDAALALNNPNQIERTDLILLAGNSGKRRKALECYIEWEKIPSEYTAGNDLQVVELFLQDGDQLIDVLYSDLWKDTE